MSAPPISRGPTSVMRHRMIDFDRPVDIQDQSSGSGNIGIPGNIDDSMDVTKSGRNYRVVRDKPSFPYNKARGGHRPSFINPGPSVDPE